MKGASTFKLYGQCVPVKGARRSIICDLQRDNYEFIPNALYAILTDHSDKRFEEILAAQGIEHKSTLTDYFTFLENNEFGFWTNTPEHFPPNSTEWHHAGAINNAILDRNSGSTYAFKTVFDQLDEIDCEHLQLRFYDEVGFDDLVNTLALLDKSGIVSVEIIKKYSPEITAEKYAFLLRRFLRITNIFIHSAPENKTWYDANVDGPLIHVVYLKNKLESEAHCGQVSEAYFAINRDAFYEALQYNSCLNKKIAIDKNGEIKNCPSMNLSYGNIHSTKLKEALRHDTFKQQWTVNKDQISICRDCEFRYICTDCRAYTAAGKTNGKPNKCDYDPYTATWNIKEIPGGG